MDALSTATSGLQTSGLQVDVAAQNIANADTPGYQRRVVQQQAQQGGGVAARSAPGPGDGTDLATETVAELTGSIAYAANARVIDVSAQLSRNLVDLLA